MDRTDPPAKVASNDQLGRNFSYCWLVELFEGDGTGNSAGWYHTGFVDIGGHSRTTKHAYEARRYHTRDAAEHVAAKLGTTLTGTWRAVEHGFAA